MADASPGTRRGGLRRSSQSRSHNPPALRPRESRSPDRVASRGQRGECRCSGPSAGGGRDGGGQDRRRRSPSVPGRGRSGSRSRGPPAAAKVAAPEILGAAANAADATPGPDRDDGRRRAAKRKGGRVAGARTAAAADQRAAGSGRRSTPRWRSGTAVGSSERAQRQWHRAAGAGGSVASPEHTQRQWQIAAPRCRDDGRRRTAGVERR